MRRILIFLIFIALSTGFGPLSFTSSNGEAGFETHGRYMFLTTHSPIKITGNFSEKAFQEGWPGVGSGADPFVIEGLQIDATGSSFGIFISSSQDHFIIKDCMISGADVQPEPQSVLKGQGMYFNSVSNGTIESCTVRDINYTGIDIRFCDNMSVKGNNISRSENSSGISIFISEDTELLGNKISDCSREGIAITGASGLLVESNHVNGNGMFGISCNGIEGSRISNNAISDNEGIAIFLLSMIVGTEFYSNTFTNESFYILYDAVMTDTEIPTNNTVNGSPIRYYHDKAQFGAWIPDDAGQVILINCTGATMADFDLERCSIGIIAMRSRSISIMNITFRDMMWGVGLSMVSGPMVKASSFTDIKNTGIMLWNCHEGMVTASHFKDAGIAMYINGNSSNIDVLENEITMADGGIRLEKDMFASDTVRDNSIGNNTLSRINGTAIYAVLDNGTKVFNNTIRDLSDGSREGTGIELYNSADVVVTGNLIVNCSTGINVSGAGWGYSKNDLVEANRIEECRRNGIVLFSSSSTTVDGNLIFMSNGPGVKADRSEDCSIVGNAFIRNNGSTGTYSSEHVQAWDGTGLNEWDDGSMGNHWSDKTSPDEDKDGIVDEPYPVGGGEASDGYPLTESPYIYLSAPLDLSATPGNGNVTLEWEAPAFDLAGGISSYRVNRYAESVVLPTLIDVPGNDYRYMDADVMNNITYTYYLTAFNKYGEGARSNAASATPDGFPPFVNITYPMDGSFVNSSYITVTWEGYDEFSYVNYSAKIDELDWMALGGNTSVELEELSDGEHIFLVKAVDTVGNTMSDEVRFGIDPRSPLIEILSPDEFNIFNVTEVEIEWSGSDDYGGTSYYSGISNYSISSGDGNWTDVGTNTSWTITGLDQGLWRISVMVFDRAGNSNEDSLSVRIDTTPPVVTIIAPSDGFTTSSTSIFVSLDLRDGETGLASIIEYRLDDGDVEFLGINWRSLPGPGSPSHDEALVNFTIEGISIGDHILTVKISDDAGNIGTSSVPFTVIEEIGEKVTISGKVVDRNGEPIEGVHVTSDDGSESMTDSNGYFVIEVEPGRRLLTFEKDGYDGFTLWVDADEDTEVPDGTVEMDEDEKDSLDLYKICLICCGIPLVALIILMLIGVFSRLVSGVGKRRRRYREE